MREHRGQVSPQVKQLLQTARWHWSGSADWAIVEITPPYNVLSVVFSSTLLRMDGMMTIYPGYAQLLLHVPVLVLAESMPGTSASTLKCNWRRHSTADEVEHALLHVVHGILVYC
jgi:hypothetical protein